MCTKCNIFIMGSSHRETTHRDTYPGLKDRCPNLRCSFQETYPGPKDRWLNLRCSFQETNPGPTDCCFSLDSDLLVLLGPIFFKYPSRLFFQFHCCLLLPNHGGIPPPSGGIVCKNRSTRIKTTVRSKRVGPLGSRGGPFTWFPH